MIEQVANVCHTTIVRDAWDRGQPLAVHGWVYGLKDGLARLDLATSEGAVAVFLRWRGSAYFHRLDALCRGLQQGLDASLAKGLPVILVGDRDIGGLIGMHLREELKIPNPIVSIDGLDLKAFDYIDIGAVLEGSGAAPVVIKSLIFPASENIGRDWQAHKITREEASA